MWKNTVGSTKMIDSHWTLGQSETIALIEVFKSGDQNSILKLRNKLAGNEKYSTQVFKYSNLLTDSP